MLFFSLMSGVQDEFPSAFARGCLSTFAPRRSENNRRDVISDIKNGFARPPTFAVFTRDLFHRVFRFPIFVWMAEVDIFDLVNRLLHGSLPCEAGTSPRRDSTQNLQFRFQGKCWFIPTSSCTERELVFRSFSPSNASVAFCFVVGFLYIGQVTGICVASAFTRTSRVFPTRVFSKMHKMSSVALPACCLPRNNPFSSILGTFS